MKKLSHSAFLLLYLLHRLNGATGYKLCNILGGSTAFTPVEIGKTSVYNGLKKMHQAGLIIETKTEQKTKRGPQAASYNLTDSSLTVLQTACLEFLKSPQEDEFELGLYACYCLQPQQVIDAFWERQKLLSQKRMQLDESYRQLLKSKPSVGEELALARKLQQLKTLISDTEHLTQTFKIKFC